MILKAAVSRMLDEELAALPSDEELLETIHVSERFEKRKRKLLRGFRVRQGMFRAVKNVAAVFVFAILGFLLAFAMNENVRAWTLQWIRTFAEDGTTAYSFPSEEADSSDDVGARTVKGIEFTYVPEGFTKAVELEEPFDPEFGVVVYEKNVGEENENILDFDYMAHPTEENNGVDNEHSVLEHIRLADGTACDFYRTTEKGNVSMLIWRWGDTLYTAGIHDYQEGWENEALFKFVNGIRLVYEE